MFGRPVVVSDSVTFRQAIRQGETGYLCSTSDEWKQSLCQLIDDDELRLRVGLAARENVIAEYGSAAIRRDTLGTLATIANNCLITPC